MTLKRYSLREMRRRPSRTMLTLLGIVIGVQSLVAIPLAIQSTRLAHRVLFEGLTGKAALEVVPCGEGGFAPELAADLEALDDVRAAVPIIQSAAMLMGPSSVVPVVTLGIDLRREDHARHYVLRSGSLLTSDDQILLQANYARSLELDLGATIQLLTPSGKTDLQVAGLLEPRGFAAVNMGAVAILPLTTSQRLFQLKDRINCLNLVLSEGADPERAALEVSRRLPRGLTVQEPAARAALAQESLLSTEMMLSVLSIGALVAGAFVILNSFLMSLGERRHSLAILRAMGATRMQVTRLLFAEAAALGMIGTVVGIPLGIGTAYILMLLMAQMSDVVPQLSLAAGPFVLAGVLGPGVAVLATYLPARNAGRGSRLSELRNQPKAAWTRNSDLRRWPGYLGIALLLSFALFSAVIMSGRLSDDLIVFLLPCCIVQMLVGCALIIPMALPPLTWVVKRLLQPVLGIEARLAVRHLQRHPNRTALVVGVLMISLILSVGYGNAILDSVRDLRAWMKHIFVKTDFLVLPNTLTGTRLLPVAMPEEHADLVGEIEGVHRVSKGSFFPSRAAGHNVMVVARSCGPGEDPGFRLLGDRDEEIREGLRRGEVVLGSAFAQRVGLRQGDQIMFETREGTRSITIAGLAADYTSGGMMALFEWGFARQLFHMEGTQFFYVTAEPEARADVDKRLKAFCDEHHLLMHSAEGFRSEVDKMIGGVIGSSWVLMALVFVVASLGITNFLIMNVLEQIRELGILRAMAMKRGQICKMVLSEALAMGMISALPGALLGVLFGYVVTHASYSVVGIRIPYTFDLWLLLGSVAMALVVAVLAALPPARWAGRLTIIRALQHE